MKMKLSEIVEDIDMRGKQKLLLSPYHMIKELDFEEMISSVLVQKYPELNTSLAIGRSRPFS
jgi:hypothetical protein